MSFSNFLELELLDHVFGASTYTAPTGVHWALSTADPTDDGSGLTEPAQSSNYSRAEYSNNKVTFSTAATEAGGAGEVFNAVAIQWPEASASWGTISHMAVYTDGSGGDMLCSVAVSGGSKAVGANDQAQIDAGEFVIQLV